MNNQLVAHISSVHTVADIRVAQRECRALVEAGHSLVLIALDSPSAPAEGVRVVRIPKPKNRIARLTRTVWSVYREAVRQNAAVYHFHDPELIPVGLLLAREHKVVFDIHENVPKQILAKDWIPAAIRPMVSSVYAALERFAARRFNALVTAGDDITARFEKYNLHVLTIGNYPLLEEFEAEPSMKESRFSLGVIANYSGMGISRRNCIHAAVDALALLPPDLDAILDLAGPVASAKLFEEVKTSAGWSRVRHENLLSRREMVRRLYGASMALVLFAPEPNSVHPRSNRLFEAMAAGLPVIGSNFPEWQEFFRAKRCGVTVDSSDSRAIAGAITYLLTHPAEAAEMGQRGRQAVLNQLNWSKEKAKLVSLYDELLSTEKGKRAAAAAA